MEFVGDFFPPAAEEAVGLEENGLFLLRPLFFDDSGVEVVMPSGLGDRNLSRICLELLEDGGMNLAISWATVVHFLVPCWATSLIMI